MINFLLRKIFRGNLNEAISLTETDVTFKVTSVSTNEIVPFRSQRKTFLKRQLTLKSKNKKCYLEMVNTRVQTPYPMGQKTSARCLITDAQQLISVKFRVDFN